MELLEAPDLKARVVWVANSLGFEHVKMGNVSCFRSRGSKSRACARIWSLPRIFRNAVREYPHYAIEFLERFEKLPEEEKDRTIIHELLHIPKKFSGGLRPHNCFGKSIERDVEELHRKLLKQFS